VTARFRPAAQDPWAGPLLPPGWRPDREAPPEDGDEPRWCVLDPDGRLRLPDGTSVLLRPFRPGDGGLLVQGFDRMSPRSRYRRFLSPVPHLTDSMLAFLTSVDGVDHRAWGALVDERPDRASPIPAGVVRWVRTKADPVVADLAVTVIDDYQGRGLGGLLLDVAVVDAAGHGVERFEGLVLGENIASRRMLARAGATFRPEEAGVLAFRLPLAPRADVLRRSPLPALVAPARSGTAGA
jgi:RimJ/RimL family protein N-acetyltransferase